LKTSFKSADSTKEWPFITYSQSSFPGKPDNTNPVNLSWTIPSSGAVDPSAQFELLDGNSRQVLVSDMRTTTNYSFAVSGPSTQKQFILHATVSPPNQIPSASVTTPSATQTGNVVISYSVVDAESENCTIAVEYSSDGGANWTAATAGSGGDGTTGLTSSPGGTSHSFVWSSASDIVNAINSNVKIRITPKDSAQGVTGITGAFVVDNRVINQIPVASVTTPSGAQSGNVAISYSLADEESEICSIVVEYSTDGGSTWKAATADPNSQGTTGLTTSAGGTSHAFVWASASDIVNAKNSNVKFRITPTDSAPGATGITGAFVVDNSANKLPVATATTPSGTQSGSVAITYILADAESETCIIAAQYSPDAGANWFAATAGSGGDGTTGLTSSPGGTSHTFVWDSAADLVNTNNSNLQFRITPTDSAPGTAGTTGVFTVVFGWKLIISPSNGTVTKSPDQAIYAPGSQVVLTATPNTGSQFLGWGGDASGNTNPLTIAMDANKDITANFTSGCAGGTPSFRALPDLPGGRDDNSGPGAVSADGCVIVGAGFSAASGSGSEAALWTIDGSVQGLGDFSGGVFDSGASDASADGSVVVGVGSPDAPYHEAFRWTSAGGMQALGSNATWATHVSADGSIIVGFYDTAGGQGGGQRHAFRWSAATGATLLPNSLGETTGWSEAIGISADGSVIIGSQGDDRHMRALRWTAAEGATELGDLPGGGLMSNTGSISDDGKVIVGWGESANGQEAFRWTAQTGMVGLGSLPGVNFYSQAFSVSGDGSIIIGRSNNNEGFIWDAAHGMRSIKAVLMNDYGFDVSGWSSFEAHDISSDGTVLVGVGHNPAGQTQGWVADLRLVVPSGTQTADSSKALGSITIGAGGRLNIAPGGTAPLRVRALNIATGGVLDLADNDMILQSTPVNRAADYAMLIGLLKSARNGGDWSGVGISSSTAAAEPSKLTGLAIILNDKGDGTPIYTQFDGEPVDANSILVKYTWNGDADLNGKLDADDYFQIDNGFAKNLIGYRNGDFDFNGSVDADDYFLIDNAFLQQTGVLAAKTLTPALSLGRGSNAAGVTRPGRHRHHRHRH
jgi:probable HAF family extracellular repeat protein